MTGFAMPRLYELSEHRYSIFSLWCVYTSVYKLLQEKVHFPIRKSVSLSLKNPSYYTEFRIIIYKDFTKAIKQRSLHQLKDLNDFLH